MSRLECLDEDGAGRSADALFLSYVLIPVIKYTITQGKIQDYKGFNDKNSQFSRKKAVSSRKSRIPISKRHDTALSARVSMAARRDGDTVALSDSVWSSIVISRHCRYTLRHTYART